MTAVVEPGLRAELLRRREVEQGARRAYLEARGRGEKPQWAAVRAIDEDNLAFLTEMLGQHGWLGSDLVGEDGASACWLMVQHAPLDYQDRWLPLMDQAVAAGRAQVRELVYLQDRVNMGHSRYQHHGTQSWGLAGGARLWPVRDPANLNARRARLGLPPLDAEVIAHAWTAEQLREHDRHLAPEGLG